MIQNRELTMDDYVGMLRRRMWVILVPALIAPAIGFGVSYFFPPKYTSTTTVIIEAPKVPGDYVKPVVTEDVLGRIASLQQQVLSRNRLQPLVERLGIGKGAEGVDQAMEEIRDNFSVTPVVPATTSTKQKKPGQPSNDVPAFNVNVTYSNPRIAQQVANQLTSMLLEENLKSREALAQGTTDFLGRQLDEAKQDLDAQDAKLADFKRKYVGQLPEDADSNLKILMGLNSQLDATTQAINRAEQDKSYAESLLAQQLTTWKASQSSTSPQALQQQLMNLQAQLVQLQARYTGDYPDVVKTKADIAEVQKKLDEINSAKPDISNSKSNLAEPPEIRQIRVQIHQYEQTIAQATTQQKDLQQEIKMYQGRVSLSPAVEEQYKELTRGYESAQKFYDDLLAKKSQSEMATAMEQQQQGEQFRLAQPANLPTDPSFPNRLLFAAGGLGGGFAIGVGLAMWLEFKDKAIRNELDVEAVMQLPALVSLPWVGPGSEDKNGSNGLSRAKADHKETVGV
ncbi:MAG TPA: Wzz/FepE/Etk N-terminal domain-containing protein [Terriglobales bacterium]|nr:Wzz/FepE/Etk N-terminal domain-containing protein [Terriglobales bacterium]